MLSITEFGAISGQGQDNTAPIQNAINTVASGLGGKLVIPPGLWLTTAPLSLPKSKNVVIQGEGEAHIRNNATNLFEGHSNIANWTFKDAMFTAKAGHVFFNRTLSGSAFDNCTMRCFSPDHSIYMQEDGPNSGFVDNVIRDCNLWGSAQNNVPTHNVPLWWLRTNANSFSVRDTRVTFAGNYAFWIENPLDKAFDFDGYFDSINFEICPGGWIKVLGGVNIHLRGCRGFDVLSYTKSPLFFGENDPGIKCEGILVETSGVRGADPFPEGVYFMELSGTLRTTISTCIRKPHDAKVFGVPGKPNDKVVIINSNLKTENLTPTVIGDVA